ncbi:MAG: hypothetical protein H7222_01955 [Methylotenera sp.]|nr:hypothetical protein [Oligoflexia bacterium]
MSKGLSKKAGVERRKKPRAGAQGGSKKLSAKAPVTAKATAKPIPGHSRSAPKKVKATLEAPVQESCYSCSKNLKGQERALFVEEEIGRIFCTEECIAQYFTPEIDRLEKEYFKHLSKADLSADDREKFSHLRWITLQEPDEVWRQKTLSGDYRYTLISEFKPGSRTIWCVCICLFLRNEPSFLYLAFPTKNAAMVNFYRRGEQVDWVKTQGAKGRQGLGQNAHSPHDSEAADGGGEAGDVVLPPTDGLADEWTETETLRAQTTRERKTTDIPRDQYELYQACLEETLETPDELWTINGDQLKAGQDESGEASESGDAVEASDSNDAGDINDTNDTNDAKEDALLIYHFIRHYADETPSHWFVIVARETDDGEQLEILDSFPTRDPELVAKFRQGRSELGGARTDDSSRVVH